MEGTYKQTEMVRKMLVKRRNVEYVLEYSNATPFLWYKGKYRCFYCAEVMKDPAMLKEHTAVMHQCANLELAVFDRTKNNRNRDAAVKIDVTDIRCKLCPQAVNSLEQLINHLIIAHDAEYDVSVPNCLLPFKLNKDQPTCPICNINFDFFEYLLRHMNKHHLAHDYICDVCGTSFQGEIHLKMHTRYYHKEGGYTCDHCGINLATLSKKAVHEKNVHMMNLSTCPHCPETFKSPYFKKLHLANVHGVEELKIKCPHCPKVFPQESIMSRHMRRVHLREKNVECPVCGVKFFGPYDVKLHMLKHNGVKKFVCSACGKKFSKKSNLNSHFLTHTGQKKHICTVCGKEFAHRLNLRIHFGSCHLQHVEQQHMSLVDGEDVELVEITRLELERIPIKNEYEESYLERLAAIRRNVMMILHYGNVVPFTWNTRGFRCFYCGKEFKECDLLKDHTAIHHSVVDLEAFIPQRIRTKDVPVKIDVTQLGCRVCDIPLTGVEDLIAHIVGIHEEEYDNSTGVCAIPFVLNKDVLQCVLCDESFDNFTSMMGHMHKKHMEQQFICQICGQSYIDQARLKRHIKNTHVGYRCKFCSKYFVAAHQLEKHKRRFHGVQKSIGCNLCSATFVNQYQLKVHMGKMHNVEKYRLKCEHCPKICTTKGAMMLHVQSLHCAARFECDICDYKTGIKWMIKLHKRKHFGEKDYTCSICDRKFGRSSNLRAHMKVHTGNFGRVCRWCRRGFTDLDSLERHEKELHYSE